MAKRTMIKLALLALLTAGLAGSAQTQNAPADGADATAAEKRQIVIKAPPGDYTVFVSPGSTPPKGFTETIAVDAPEGAEKLTVLVVDKKTGYAARQEVTLAAGTTNVELASDDFTLVHRVKVLATGKGGQPVALATVTLTDAAGIQHSEQIDEGSQGEVVFRYIPRGEATITVLPDGGAETIKKLDLELAPGETELTVPVAMPEVENVVAATAPVAPADAIAPAPSTTATPAAPPAEPAPDGGGWGWRLLGNLLGWMALAAVVYGVYVFAKKNQWTVEKAVKALGVQPEIEGGVQPSSGPSQPVNPGVAPAPPPVVEDPNACQFCGEVKDAAGNCGCTVAPGQGLPAAAPVVGVASSAGPRLIGTTGTYMGHIFPVSGETVIGRDAANAIALDQDSSVSRRHAVIFPQDGGYALRDEGSSNGTMVNGARVTETALQPGDEVSIGGTRFRFEV